MLCIQQIKQFQRRMKIVTSLSLLIYAVFVKSLSNSQRLQIDLFVNNVPCYVNCLSKFVSELYAEKNMLLEETLIQNVRSEMEHITEC